MTTETKPSGYDEGQKYYQPDTVENKWYAHWLAQKYFESQPNHLKPYTVVIPPPNVTGVLHLGHTLNATIQDILIRKARMSGLNACWVPGCDHASIATEAKVVEMLKKEKGIHKKDLSREAFLKYVFEWKEKYGQIIYQQLQLLGCSVDWRRATFTMDKHYEQAVIKVFVALHQKGYIYKGARMIHWDVEAQTALSDEEVEYKEVESQLVYVKYFLVNEDGSPSATYLTIATQRPETIMGDVALCAHPNDERYQAFKGKKVFIPIIQKAIPIIFDEYVDPEFGTGLLKITPAHDINDYQLGLKHQLPVIDVLTNKGIISEQSPIYVGMERFQARVHIIQDLEQQGYVDKIINYTTKIGLSQRTNTVVEPRISTQWFVKTETLNQKALKAVEDKKVKIHPEERFLNTYKHWLNNPKDWCISRQLWWGQRIPAYYTPDGAYVVAENKQQAFDQLQKKHPHINIDDITQDEDCLDTWFSSWLFPLEVFKGITNPNNPDFQYYYPTTTLVTGQDIIFFWVARMIMAGMELQDKEPFEWVYFTGMVRDNLGRKMSKSLGNSPDLIALIKTYGADAVRFGVMIAAPAGNDLLFDESALQQGQRFNNKLWNTLKLIHILKQKTQDQPLADYEKIALDIFEQRLRQQEQIIQQCYTDFKLSEGLKTIYSLIWDDFCSDFLEWIKPHNNNVISLAAYQATLRFFEHVLHLLHPYMPFITEELYHLITPRDAGNDLAIKQYAETRPPVDFTLQEGQTIKHVLTALRDVRTQHKMPNKQLIPLHLKTQDIATFQRLEPLIMKQGYIDKIIFCDELRKDMIPIIIGKTQLGIPQQAKSDEDALAQNEALLKERAYLEQFAFQIGQKINNEKFIQHAKPEVIAFEKKKYQDILDKIKSIEQSLNSSSL